LVISCTEESLTDTNYGLQQSL